MVIQTHGRNGQYNPHLHVIATSGGWDAAAKQWRHLDYLPYPLLRKKWQWHLLTMLRQTVKSKEIHRLVDTCYTRYREGFVTNVQKGDVPARYQSWRATWPNMSSVRRSRCGVLTGMMGTASPLTTVPTKASGSSKKRWRSTPLLGVWCSMSSPRASNGFAITGSKRPKPLPG